VTWHQPVNNGGNSWNIIAGLQPATDLASQWCNAMPGVSFTPADLSSVAGTSAHTYTLQRITSMVMGRPVGGFNIEILVKWHYGVRYKGAGSFIPVCWVEVPTCYITPGHEIWTHFTVDSVANAATATAPNARLRMRIVSRVRNPNYDVDTEGKTLVALGDGSAQW
jgi:hypothetical protein